MSSIDLDKKYIANCYGRFNLLIEKGQGSTLFDINGNKYIDFTSGIGVNSFGACDNQWQKAVFGQLNKIQHTSNLYYTEPGPKLAQLLIEKCNMSKVCFSNSGAEANECAIKFARKYSHQKYNTDRSTIITLKDSFHGRTITTLSATGQDMFHTDFEPFTKGFEYAEANNVEDLRSKIDETVCAIMFECIQGEGGVCDLDAEFINEISRLCKQHDLISIIDEVQTGNGRTGKYFAYQHFGFEPDIVTTAKGLGGGLPIGAIIFNDKFDSLVTPGSHGSTYAGNPVCCAAALSVVSRINQDFLNDVGRKSAIIREKLNSFKNVQFVSGKGLMIGIRCNKDANLVADLCLKNNLLVLTAHKNMVRLLPPLNITDQEMKAGMSILESVIEDE